MMLSACRSAEPAPPVVAVFGLDGRGSGLEQADLDQLSDLIGASLAESGRYHVVALADLKGALSQRRDCHAQSCQREVGRAVGATKSVAGSVKRFGESCIVTLQVLDLAKATQEMAGTGTGRCSADAVLTSLQTALGKLTGQAPLSGASSVAPQVVAKPAGDESPLGMEVEAEPVISAKDATEKNAREQAVAKKWDKQPAGKDGMVEVPAGEFYMGCNERVDSECSDDERPGKVVSAEPFRIDQTEVTVVAYKKCVDAGGCSAEVDTGFFDGEEQTGAACNWGKKGSGDQPINCVSWHQAEAYCRWARKRLPTEKEWEKAARGADGRKYPWGNTAVSCSYAIIGEMQDGCGRYSTWPVGSKPQGNSPFGVRDMIGNVWEWTSDWHTQHETRVLRGGSWANFARSARASARLGSEPSNRYANYGFRCAKSD